MTSAQPLRVCLGFRGSRSWGKWGLGPLTPVGALLAWLLLGNAITPAQDLSGRLPPPPTVSVPDLAPNNAAPSWGAPLPDTLPNVSPNTIYRSPTSDRPIPSDRYIVYVNGTSPLLLQQIRTSFPTAFLTQYQGQALIQTGSFGNLANAQRQVQVLNAQGIQADILTSRPGLPANVPATPPPPLLSPNQTSVPNNAVNAAARYVVVIPAAPETFNSLTAQAIRLGIRPNAIQQRQSPLGPHLEIGPFAQRSAAEEINRYLRKQGMDTRVFFNR
jgi:hypothetical protein